MVLTSSGQRLLEFATKLIDQTEAFEEQLHENKFDVHRQLRLGSYPPVVAYGFPGIMNFLAQRFSHCDFQVETNSSTRHLTTRLLDHELDLIFGSIAESVGDDSV
jgi:DNA-binding transcriptional LysR family regulator